MASTLFCFDPTSCCLCRVRRHPRRRHERRQISTCEQVACAPRKTPRRSRTSLCRDNDIVVTAARAEQTVNPRSTHTTVHTVHANNAGTFVGKAQTWPFFYSCLHFRIYQRPSSPVNSATFPSYRCLSEVDQPPFTWTSNGAEALWLATCQVTGLLCLSRCSLRRRCTRAF